MLLNTIFEFPVWGTDGEKRFNEMDARMRNRRTKHRLSGKRLTWKAGGASYEWLVG